MKRQIGGLCSAAVGIVLQALVAGPPAAAGVRGAAPALASPGVPHSVRNLWGPWARPLRLRRVDVDLDGDRDLIAILEDRGLVRVAVTCREPGRFWQPWRPCGGFGLAEQPRAGSGAGAVPPPAVVRLQTGDLDADGRTDLAAEVVTEDGVHHLALGPLRYPEHEFPPTAGLHLKARRFLLWDVNQDGRVEVVAGDLQGAGPGPAFVTFVHDSGRWRRGHGAAAPPALAMQGVLPAVRVPDVRTELLAPAAAQLAAAGLRPGMVAAVDMGGRGFRDVTVLLPPVGNWARRGTTVHLALAVPVAHGYVTEWGEVERVVITSPGRQMELWPGQEGYADVEAGFRRVLASAERRVKVGGPSFDPPAAGPLVYYSATRAEFFLKRPLRLVYQPQRTSLTAQRVMIPFTRYEEGLAFLGTPDYQEAVLCTGWVGELANTLSRFFPVPRE